MNWEEKGALGVRYLLKYIENPNSAYLDVVKDNINEIKFFSYLMLFCNNMDELYTSIPELLLKDIFECAPIKYINYVNGCKQSKIYEYGSGFYSNHHGLYHSRLRLIRNALAHGDFTFDGNIINICDGSFKCHFDLKWFFSLASISLSNNKTTIQKDIIDYSVIGTVDYTNYQTNDLLDLFDQGKLSILKFTCVASSSKDVENKLNITDLSFDCLMTVYLNVLTEKLKQGYFLKDAIKILHQAFKGILKVEIIPINSKSLNNPYFNNLPINEAINYLINELGRNSRITKNTIDVKTIDSLLDKLINNENIPLSLEYELPDLLEYLTRVYSYILFAIIYKGHNPGIMAEEVFREYASNITLGFKHAKNVWLEYIKRITKGINILKEKNMLNELVIFEERLRLYQNKLAILEEDDIYALLFSNIRNALTHDFVTLSDAFIKIEARESPVDIPKINSKTKEVEYSTFKNNSQTMELITDIDTFLSIIDRLYELVGLKVSVNISKYRKRKNYLQNIP